ncbi:hypothetical protein CYMTET_7616 [Cymbomonas tetramitiformis]|uniref:ABC transporter domain-containing protein n=1 Tax=Cymbomonas tetramitiformis TaxID=36881 RepID=A0AAE0LHB7_9CHLO|nr:hypothetical protein CYMTET_7616 [Cymbomonas tetramitiformis]
MSGGNYRMEAHMSPLFEGDQSSAEACAQPSSARACTLQVSQSTLMKAVLVKNYKLKTRGILCCCTVTEIVLPLVFFLIMCIPVALIEVRKNNDVFYKNNIPIYERMWASTGTGTSSDDTIDLGLDEAGVGFRVLYSPNNTDAKNVARATLLHLMCDAKIAGDSHDQDFYYQLVNFYEQEEGIRNYDVDVYNQLYYESQPNTHAICQECVFQNSSISSPCAKYDELLEKLATGFDDVEDAVQDALEKQGTVFAVIAFENLKADDYDIRYTLRTNGSYMVYEDERYGRKKYEDKFAPRWGCLTANQNWKLYYTFSNVQNALDEALLDYKSCERDADCTWGTSEFPPSLITANVKSFPWLHYEFSLGTTIAGAFFSILMVFAFISTTVLIMKSIVTEKELRLREGMMLMGLPSPLYWASWFLSHWSNLVITSFFLTLIGMYVFPNSNPGLMFLFYIMWAASLVLWCYAISTLFNRSKVAAIASSILFVTCMAPAIAVETTAPDGSAAWTAVCLLPSSSIYMFGKAVQTLEIGQYGVQINTLNDDLLTNGNVTVGNVYLMVFIDILMYTFLTWYLDKVMPRQWGTVEKPWFLFTSLYWRGATGETSSQQKAAVEGLDAERFEALSEDQLANPAVQIFGLTRTFGDFTAVDRLSGIFPKGEISALLGHNGAGKTTTMSMLTGMIAPTSGSALINGLDINTSMSTIRSSMGLCPQFDILWPTLTVREHLQLVASFKGIPAVEMQSELLSKVREIGLVEKLDELTGSLSGGQKRKLSLAMAFMGEPSVVLLDEPTSGMDPYSRRFVWEVIRQKKATSSIILTTHFMDEADILSDRINVMSEGTLTCSGSSVFLKNRFGLGYNLTLVKVSPETLEAPVTDVIRRHVQQAEMASNVGTELAYKLPSKDTPAFPALLAELDASLEALGLETYGLSCTTLEEVFLSLAHDRGDLSTQRARAASAMDRTLARTMSKSASRNLEDTIAMAEGHSSVDPLPSPPQKFLTGGHLKTQQFKALITKRLINMRRDMSSIVTQLLIPVLFVFLALILASLSSSDGGAKTYFDLAIDDSLLDGKRTHLARSMNTSASTDVDRLLDTFGKEKYREYQGVTKQAPCSCFCPTKLQTSDICYAYGDDPNHGRPCKEVDLEHNTISTSETCAAVEQTLDGTILSYAEAITACSEAGSDVGCDGLYLETYLESSKRFNHTIYVSPTAFHGLPAGMNRINSAIFRTMLGGAGGITARSHPLPDLPRDEEENESDSTLTTVIFLVIGLSCLSASFTIFLVWEKMNNAKHLQMVSGVDKLMFWITSYLSDLMSYAVPYILILICFAAFNVEGTRGEAFGTVAVLFWVFGMASIPFTYAFHFAFNSEMNALATLMGGYFFLSLATILCNVILGQVGGDTAESLYDTFKVLFLVLPHYCVGMGMYELLSIDTSGNDTDDTDDSGESKSTPSPYDWDVTGDKILALAVGAVVYFGLTLFIEYFETTISAFVGAGKAAGVDESVVDEDVLAEQEKVLSKSTRATDSIIIDGLAKTYPNGKAAVRPLHVALPRGECFGLLGINGAGKTSTFRMLTGEFPPSSGDALMRGRSGESELLSIRRQLSEARQCMGYCPQFDGIQPNMTAREHLYFYATIRGVPPAQVQTTAERLLERMALSEYADRQAGTYSGGNKRKLSVAIAMVGDPPIVLLDEPSTGMDPQARRFMWNVIASTMTDRAVILTSHSMEECEALCTRVAIMVGGQFRCLGSIQHLKNRFSEGYMLDIRSRGPDIATICTEVPKALAGAELIEQHETHAKFRVPCQKSAAAMFDAVETLRAQVHIEDYSLAQTTLEQVFVRFASQQNEEKELAPGLVGGSAVEGSHPAESIVTSPGLVASVPAPEAPAAATVPVAGAAPAAEA